MPIYEYKCSVCQRKIELLKSINDPDPLCCGGAMVKVTSIISFPYTGKWAKGAKGVDFSRQSAREVAQRQLGEAENAGHFRDKRLGKQRQRTADATLKQLNDVRTVANG